MSSLVTQIREGIADKLAPLKDVQVSPYMLANPTPPTVEVFPSGSGETAVEYDRAMGRGLDTWMFTVRALVPLSSDQGAQRLLDEMLAPKGATSIKALIETKAAGETTVTLGGVAQDARVTSSTGYRLYTTQAGQAQLLGCEWFVHVIASGK